MNETFKGSWARSTCELYSVADFYLLHVRKDIFFFFVLWCIGRQGNRPEPFLVGWSHIHTDVPPNFPTCQFFFVLFFSLYFGCSFANMTAKENPQAKPSGNTTTFICYHLNLCLVLPWRLPELLLYSCVAMWAIMPPMCSWWNYHVSSCLQHLLFCFNSMLDSLFLAVQISLSFYPDFQVFFRVHVWTKCQGAIGHFMRCWCLFLMRFCGRHSDATTLFSR